MIALLSAYLKIKTDHPHPDYQGVFDFFIAQATRDQLPYQLVPLSPTTAALIISLAGSDTTLSSLVLNHHCDVVGAPDGQSWQAPPFAGTIIDGMIIGRGAQDMKSVGIMHYAALAHIRSSKMPLRRSVHCIIVPDEERGGFQGTAHLIKTSQFKQLNVGYVIDEGMPSGSPEFLYLKVAERKPLQLKISITRSGGHASDESISNPITELYRCINQVSDMRVAADDFSLHITTLQAGDGIHFNQVPAQATAIIDLRIAPSIQVQTVREKIESIVAQYQPSQVEFLAAAADGNHHDQQKRAEYVRIVEVLRRHDLSSIAFTSNFASDLRYYWSSGIAGIGLTPCTDKSLMHARDEKISVTDLERGKAIFIDIIKSLCS